MSFNENTRVKIPAILHLSRLGFRFLPLANAKWDRNTNIFTDIFKEGILRLNPLLDANEVPRILEDITSELDYEDLGHTFFQRLTSRSGNRLIDFENFRNNSLHVVTELPCVNEDEEFRPDITLLVNGLPLAFIEVKKPNNRDGILAERERINTRFRHKHFRRFINISQILVFSNNMEYDSSDIEPIQGVFYSTTASHEAQFNFFREEESLNLSALLAAEDDGIENLVLQVTNLLTMKHSPEFQTNKKPESPTNRVLTSLFSPERFSFLLQYGLAYVKSEAGLEKHIMRYPQLFATKAIERNIASGVRKGVIWHTQGSGKTALSYYAIQHLTDYFSRQHIVPKFYFIVDRIDLLNQAKSELSSRGLVVHAVDSRDGFVADFTKQQAVHNQSGSREVTVVNIQKFTDESSVLPNSAYSIETQRIYFLDEAHRSYNPKGSFLANIINADRNAIFIGLTGTPLIGNAGQTTSVFGPYFHKYYYNASIADGYTLRLIREAVETNYAIQMKSLLEQIQVQEKSIDPKLIGEHDRYAEPMLDYVVTDFLKTRDRLQDHSIGGMIVCNSSEQAKKLFRIFKGKYNFDNPCLEDAFEPFAYKCDIPEEYLQFQKLHQKLLTASLILHDVGTKEERKQQVTEFKKGEFDLLIVYNMLLTGFDAKRLKKLYLGRVVKAHNLLQTLTRVNRPYKKFRYGFVVDFADISTEFDATNQAYFKELNSEYGEDEMSSYSNIFKSKDEIIKEIEGIHEALFEYDLKNAEVFSQQISAIQDRSLVLKIKKALESARELFNMIKMLGHAELLEITDFRKLSQMYNEASRHLDLLNLKESVENSIDTTNLLNSALENVLFLFTKGSEEELKLADQLKDQLRKTREAMANNFDQKDPEFVSLYEELKRLFQDRKLDEVSQQDMENNIKSLEAIFVKIADLNRRNNLLKAKYAHDEKYARLHKRLRERNVLTQQQQAILKLLNELKQNADQKVLNNQGLLENDKYFDSAMIKMVIDSLQTTGVDLDPETARFIGKSLSKEYLDEFEGAA